MKLFNIFKKKASNKVKSNIQKIDKKQLEKVIGGGDEAAESTSKRLVFSGHSSGT